ncbi:MAG: hypothetical protein HY799_01970 [Nitrosomonadales bacterium]|nr:hypothetical protein [Nitrosomonadales bacterium]
MIGRILLAISILTIPLSVEASWDVGGGLEDYQWIEYPVGFSGTPKETGMRSAVFVNWTQDAKSGALFAWRAKLYGGTVDYDTFLMSTGAPVSTKTDYSGASSEAQLVYREDHGAYKLDYLGSLGLDTWRRSIRNTGSDQIEDYSILFMRAGLRLAKSRSESGFHGEIGIKYPVSTWEDAHLDSMGYTSNPGLSPEGQTSGYAELGYRINSMFDVRVYYDSWRFGRSKDVTATDTTGATWLIHQPKSNMDAKGLMLLVSF